jgi:hypothetical protein
VVYKMEGWGRVESERRGMMTKRKEVKWKYDEEIENVGSEEDIWEKKKKLEDDYVDLGVNQSGKCGDCFGIAITWEELKILVWLKTNGAIWEKPPLEIVSIYPGFSWGPILQNSLFPY